MERESASDLTPARRFGLAKRREAIIERVRKNGVAETERGNSGWMASIGKTLGAAYATIARTVLLRLEAFEDRRAAGRLVTKNPNAPAPGAPHDTSDTLASMKSERRES